MLIKYYNNAELAYANRKRYNNFNFSHFYEEEQRSVLLGDGATTSIKTSKDNICNYVTIDNTRWYVVSYVFLNGGQVRLNLQRDVIGEFGITDFFGKVERGITNNILKNKRELTLNQILKRRIPLKSTEYTYGDWSLNTHDNECWGILYLKEPRADGSNSININIPELSVPISTLPNPNNIILGRKYLSSIKGNSFFTFGDVTIRFKLPDGVGFQFYQFSTRTRYTFIENDLQYDFTEINLISYSNEPFNKYVSSFFIDIDPVQFIDANNLFNLGLGSITSLELCKNIINEYFVNLFNVLKNGTNESEYQFDYDKSYFTLKDFIYDYSNRTFIDDNYNNAIITETSENVEKYYKYSIQEEVKRYLPQGNLFRNPETGLTTTESVAEYYEKITVGSDRKKVLNKQFSITNQSGVEIRCIASGSVPTSGVDYQNPILYNQTSGYFELSYKTLTREEIVPEEEGVLVLKTIRDFVDEPYSIYIMPLFDVELSSGGNKILVNKSKSFNLFNSIIQSLYGNSGYLVDAQIYPYCPNLNQEVIKFNEVPLFTPKSTSFTRESIVSLDVFDDVKKEYICRQLSIVSPDQSNKFSFNFYDYYSSKKDFSLNIKTALKPFSIISSAVINRDFDSLMGIGYDSDLRGCQPTSNGFEVSLSTDQFQDYVRNNSNYEKIFNKNQEYLEKQHEVEKGNEITQLILNTLSMTAMGAIAGASMGDAGLLGEVFGTKSKGAILGATTAGTVTLGTNIAQLAINNGLREYEQNLQKELFSLDIGQIKNLPNNISRISSFNEILLKDFYYVLEIYECSEEELQLVDLFLEKYSYSLGVYGLFYNYYSNGRFLKGNLITSSLIPNLHNIATKEIQGGVYYYGN